MRLGFLCTSLVCLIIGLFGCSAGTTDVADANADVSVEIGDVGADGEGTQFALSPENTLIQFVGTHVGEVPDPKARTGKFEDFAGTAVLGEDFLISLSLEIQMASVQTGNDKLNNHLQNEDFFSVREYPTAKFVSSSVVSDGSDQKTITGDLQLHSQTKEISFPATVSVVDGQLKLSGKMTLDRAEFGMDKMTEKVNSAVEMTFEIGGEAG